MTELARGYRELQLDGMCIVPIVADHVLDHEEYIPLLSELSRRQARLMLHPVNTDGEPLLNEQYLDAVLALSRLFYYDRIRHMTEIELFIAHSSGVTEFLSENIGMLYYLQERKMRIGSFLYDFLVKHELKGSAYIKSLDFSEQVE